MTARTGTWKVQSSPWQWTDTINNMVLYPSLLSYTQ